MPTLRIASFLEYGYGLDITYLSGGGTVSAKIPGFKVTSIDLAKDPPYKLKFTTDSPYHPMCARIEKLDTVECIVGLWSQGANEGARVAYKLGLPEPQ